jgi:hypothetical protein
MIHAPNEHHPERCQHGESAEREQPEPSRAAIQQQRDHAGDDQHSE